MEDEFEVEKILGKKSRNGRVTYKIRWKGFDEREDTWEPEENLTHCQELLDSYNFDKERDMTIIDQTIVEKFPRVAKESSLLSSPKFTSTPASVAVDNHVKKVKRPERLLKQDDMRNSFNPRVNKERINQMKYQYTDSDDEPYSRWPLLLLVIFATVLILLVVPAGDFT